MRILVDQGVPLPLKSWLTSHEVEAARQRGWSELLNGELLAAAQGARLDLFITTNQNLRHQQDLSRFAIAVLVLMVANWPALEPFASKIAAAVDKVQPRQYVEWSPV
jgi:hypothetical protein